jgi:mannose/fructose/N-acetylgalactosamine-specific phosphotransferase system component IID
MYEFLEKLKKWMIITFVGCGGALALIAFIGGFFVPGIRYYPHYYKYSYRFSVYENYLMEIRQILALVLLVFVAVAAVLFVMWLLVKRPKPLVSLIRITIIAIIALYVWALLIWAIPYLVKYIILLFY